jgi:PleD family two-component response regulator
MDQTSISKTDQHQSSANDTSTRVTDKKQIFIVEDDVELAQMLTTYFYTHAYAVRSATSGKEAVQLILDDTPDLVLLDIRLGDIDGYEVYRRLRGYRSTQHIPIIFLTERREKNYKLAGLELGAVDYITKPFDIGELRLRVRNTLRRSDKVSMQNAVTGLLAGTPVQEQLARLLLEEDHWHIMTIKVDGIARFRDMYGFVTADDVTRAISLMIKQAMEDVGVSDHFIGHVGASDFIVITDADRCAQLQESCRARLTPAIQYFYPVSDRHRIKELPAGDRLAVDIHCLSSADNDFDSLESLQNALFQLFE